MKFCFIKRGKISVGEREVKIYAMISNTRFSVFLSCGKYHKATPHIAIINVGDSALWLNIITNIKVDAKKSILKILSPYCLMLNKGSIKIINPARITRKLGTTIPNHDDNQPITERPCDLFSSVKIRLNQLLYSSTR